MAGTGFYLQLNFRQRAPCRGRLLPTQPGPVVFHYGFQRPEGRRRDDILTRDVPTYSC
jgi:hypothetical protein